MAFLYIGKLCFCFWKESDQFISSPLSVKHLEVSPFEKLAHKLKLQKSSITKEEYNSIYDGLIQTLHTVYFPLFLV